MNGPGGPAVTRVGVETQRLDAEFVLPTYARLPVEFVSGEGTQLIDVEGRRYLDFVTGLSVSNFGHAHPAVVEAIRTQAGQLIHCSNLFYTAPQARLAARLSKLANGGRVFFGNSGAEANEAAIKVARKRCRDVGGGAILTLERSFHGRTMATLSATGQREKQAAFSPTLEVFEHVAVGDSEGLRALFRSGRIAAFLAEPVLGESGVRIVPGEFLAEAQELCRQNDALFIVDEVQTGLGRCGAPFAYQRYGLEPDVVTVAKSLAGGLPMGAAIVGERAWDVLVPGDHGSTFGGGPVVAAAALAVLDLVEDPQLPGRVEELGHRLQEHLGRLTGDGRATDLRRLGLMVAVDLTVPVAKDLVGAALDDGLLLNATSEHTLRFLPPLTVSEEEIDRVGAWLTERVPAGEGP